MPTVLYFLKTIQHAIHVIEKVNTCSRLNTYPVLLLSTYCTVTVVIMLSANNYDTEHNERLCKLDSNI